MTAVRTAGGVQVRQGQVYAYLTLVFDPFLPLARTGVELGYVGQTTQGEGKRDAQHKVFQPWADVIAEGPIVLVEGAWVGTVDAAGRWSSPDLDAVERAAIGGRWGEVLRLCDRLPGVRVDVAAVARVSASGGRPRYNVEHNRDNPFQVPQWVAVEQRHARDVAAGRLLWQPPVRVPAQRRSAPAVVPSSFGDRVAAAVNGWWRGVRWWVAGWTVAAVTAGVLVLTQVPAATAGGAAWAGVVAGSGVVWLVWDGRRRRLRVRRRVRGRSRAPSRARRSPRRR